MSSRWLYRRCLRAASYCVENQRAWMASYVRIKFRDEALVGGAGSRLTARLKYGEDELQQMLATLQKTGRLPTAGAVAGHAWVARWAVGEHSGAASTSEHETLAVAGEGARAGELAGPPRRWSEVDVGCWLRALHLERHADAFAEHRIDGGMLFELDDLDLRDELRVESRLERKRILAKIGELRDTRGG
mmetsp:Transcript_63545/g.169382  ORF Transcript_63545/g.169382 Transcript_63545/m.169382 type:complete len:189 (-) Transcript_63545:54-620(-)|eukprot:2691643-Prymnesium_polylepis.1